MGRIKYSNFESIQEIIGHFDFSHDENLESKKQQFFDDWEKTVGQKISKMTKPVDISQKGLLTVSCANSFVANELHLSKGPFLELIQEKAKELQIDITDIRFDYKNWKKK